MARSGSCRCRRSTGRRSARSARTACAPIHVPCVGPSATAAGCRCATGSGKTCLRKARHIITGATSWLALHGGLIGLGLRYIRHGRGARIEEAATQETMPACHLGTAFGLHHLEARLGQFLAGPSVAPETLDARAQARRGYRDARDRRRDTLSRLTSVPAGGAEATGAGCHRSAALGGTEPFDPCCARITRPHARRCAPRSRCRACATMA